jgi:hypothetical protein
MREMSDVSCSGNPSDGHRVDAQRDYPRRVKESFGNESVREIIANANWSNLGRTQPEVPVDVFGDQWVLDPGERRSMRPLPELFDRIGR